MRKIIQLKSATLFLTILLSLNITAQTEPIPLSILVEKAGTLPILIDIDQKYAINSLIVTGELNGTDIAYIRDMAGNNAKGYITPGKLSALDISGVKIVAGGNYYYKKTDSFFTSNDSIGNFFFEGCEKLCQIILPESAVYIGNSVFQNCTGLTALAIPKEIQFIGGSAFNGCTNLLSFTIPKNVKYIGSSAFKNCRKITEVILEDGKKNLLLEYNSSSNTNRGLFSDCPLTKVHLGRNLEYLVDFKKNDSPFLNQSALTTVTIGDSVTIIRNSTFRDCTELTSIIFPNSLISIEAEAFKNCTKLATIDIPNSVTIIGNSAFQDCTELTSIIFPNSLTSIGEMAFKSCTKLTAIDIPNSVTTLGYCAFQNCSSASILKTGNGLINLNSAFLDCSGFTSITFGKKIARIDEYTFENCVGLTSLTIPPNVTFIGGDTFKGCTGLKELIFERGDKPVQMGAVTTCCYGFHGGHFDGTPFEKIYLGRHLFAGNTRPDEMPFSLFQDRSTLTSVTLASSLLYLDEYTFKGCWGLTECVIEDSDKPLSIEFENLYGPPFGPYLFCDSPLKSLYQGRELIYINRNKDDKSHIFRNKKTLTTVTLGNNVSVIKNRSFAGCSNLTTVTLGNNVTNISKHAFNGCEKLTHINIPNSVQTIEDSAFFNCKELAALDIPQDISLIGESAFGFCSKLTSIPEFTNLSSISNFAFLGCSQLTSITLPNNITSLGFGSFGDCTGLKEISCKNTVVPTIEQNTFERVDKTNCMLYVTKGYAANYRSSNYWNEFENIEEKFSSIHSINKNGLRIYPYSDKIRIEGAKPGSLLYIYVPSGLLIKIIPITQTQTEVQLPPQRIYIVKGNGQTTKIAL